MRNLCTIFVGSVCLLHSARASAAVIVEHTSAAFQQDQIIPGQSLLTPGPSAWKDLRFNWFSDIAATIPTAFGSLFLFDQEYLGAPGAMSSLTPGFVGQSQSIVAGQYVFDPSVTINPNTKYFFYATQAGLLAGEIVGTYGGGILYSDNASGPGGQFFRFETQDAVFRLEGSRTPFIPSPVPEPATLALWSLAAFCAVALGRSRKRRQE
jgi:hypothetical protein